MTTPIRQRRSQPTQSDRAGRNYIPLAPPEGFSVPEAIVYQELHRLGYEDGIDFTFRSRFFNPSGGSILGTIEADFIFRNPPNLAIDVQGVFVHYEQGASQIGRDRIAQAQLAGLGITLVFIDDDDLLQSEGRMRFVVSEALAYRDHSRLTRGFR